MAILSAVSLERFRIVDWNAWREMACAEEEHVINRARRGMCGPMTRPADDLNPCAKGKGRVRGQLVAEALREVGPATAERIAEAAGVHYNTACTWLRKLVRSGKAIRVGGGGARGDGGGRNAVLWESVAAEKRGAA